MSNRPARKLADNLAYPPRAFRADRAAAYLSVSTTKFLEWVEQGKMPKGAHIDGVVLWDRLALDLAFDAVQADSDRPNGFDAIVDQVRRG
jgi:hypothetical protein